MKEIAFCFVILFVSFSISGQEMNQVILDTSINQDILFGYCNRDGFENDLFKAWFNAEYEMYIVDEDALSEIDFENNAQPEITIVMATWCSDSRREVPRFYKMLDYLEYDEDNLTLINVNRQKEAGEVETAHLDIELVPTFIIYENGMERGRIIETPVKSLEKDFAEILSE